ncbi:vesicle transport protein GOT1 isoform X3 [Quercus robur]|uniref:vesicle transport protein GOT1 isoform X3 n=1 Tax=Quercus robur TaxID=38942 RepID=UPI0021617690|nr:vesicle transport protein GOT1 isoform X3 [Quercus robur]XP_050256846.1 vesicle transport protein GOT1 isoform X3 [Quercus robur]
MGQVQLVDPKTPFFILALRTLCLVESKTQNAPFLSHFAIFPTVERCFLFATIKETSTVIRMVYELTEQKKIGLGLIGFGIVFTFLGVVLFFDRGLLALSNIFCLTGVALLLGWRSTWNLFTNRANYKGSAAFLLGLFFLFVRWPIVAVFGHLSRCFSIRFQF